MTETVTESSTRVGEPNTLVNALLGGVVSVVLGFVPFSPVLGGGVAGYLQGTDTGRGVRVGIYAGLVVVFALVVLYTVGLSALGGSLGAYVKGR